MTTIPITSYTRWDKEEPSLRPYRLWDANAKRDMRWRYYKIKRNALDGALLEARWAKVGTAIEVYDCRSAQHLGTFKRHVTTISFTNSR